MMTAIPISRYLAELPVTRLAGDGQAHRVTRLTKLAEVRPEQDYSMDIERAYRRGLEEGRAAARIEYAKHIDDLRREAEADRMADRMAWTQAEAARFAEDLEASLVEVEGRIAEVVARVLEPFLVEAQRRRAVHELIEAISTLTQRQQGLDLSISGPEDLLVALGERLNGRVKLNLSVTDTPDVRVSADDTVIETRLGGWIASLSEATRV